MTTVTVLVNGETEEEIVEGRDASVNMVSGFNCLAKMDSIALKEKSENFQIELKNALSGVINNCEQRKTDKEIQFLKELIVSHLDIIQQQSEQLAIKDRIINKLKNEKETLLMRLLRMERRVNLERSRFGDDKNETDSTIPSRSQTMQTSTRLPRRPSTECLTKAKQPGGAPPPSPTPGQRESKKPRRNRHGDGEDVDGSENGTNRRANTKLISERLYYTCVGEQECRWGLDPLQPSKAQCLLEVPSWRIRSYSSSYTMEGTENLSDEVFERRHSNLYKDEKRRKRWDVQRIREMRHNEKLRQRQMMVGQSSTGSKSETESLWPRPTRETQLIVHQSVPVAAFGVTLTCLPHRDFSFSSFTLPSSKYSKFAKRLKR